MAEEPDPWRTCFERDRDRILHASAFRRLAGKTQVFVFPDDHQRTRLTHALEVAQVATAVARALRLNVALTEAIALGHDCGHGPGGHASEDALSPYVAGGYDHAVWGADVVLAPLNLCAETLDGIRNHSWSRPAPATPEGEVVSWADRIAYVCHDFEDAVAAGIVTPDMLPGRRSGPRCGTTRSQPARRVHRRRWSTPRRPPAASAWPTTRPRRWPRSGQFNYEHIYLRPASVAPGRGRDRRAAGAGRALRRPAQPAARRTVGGGVDAGSAEALRAAVTYVGGMTDRFACQQAAGRCSAGTAAPAPEGHRHGLVNRRRSRARRVTAHRTARRGACATVPTGPRPAPTRRPHERPDGRVG